ncbi:MAG: TIGR04076 family protein [Deltaproteobacteria bacterium]|nr:TIGR04076 family protein [Deltaproteobacteria bacterium]
MLEITVHDIKGNCPVHNVGDRIIIQNPEINLEDLPTILHYVLILEHKWIPFQLGLTKEDDPDNAYIQCLDPGQPYTEGGTVIFRIRKIAHHL